VGIFNATFPKGPVPEYYEMSTFITLGNSKFPFVRLLEFAERNASLLPKPILAQIGNTEYQSAIITCVKFLPMDKFQDNAGRAKLVMCHAGAGAVINAITRGNIPLILPRRASLGEHIDDHQMELANVFEGNGAAFRIDGERTLPELLEEIEERRVPSDLDGHANEVLIEVENCFLKYGLNPS
jgi:UDP-N-acetylglucosamine transferase subunit ALG13